MLVRVPLLWAAVVLTFSASNSIAQSKLLLGPSSIDFLTATPSSPPLTQRLLIASDGESLPFEAKPGYWSAASDWLSIQSAAGTTPSTLDLSVDTKNLAPGVYFGYVEVTSASAKSVIPVTLRIGEYTEGAALLHPRISSLRASPNAIKIRAGAGVKSPLVRAIGVVSNTGTPSAFTASSDSSWLAVGPQAGDTTSSNIVTLAVDFTAMPLGTHTALVNITPTGTGDALTIPVTVDLVAQASSGFTADKSSITLQGPLAGPPQSTNLTLSTTGPQEQFAITVRNTTLGEYSCDNYGYTCWLTVNPRSGSTPGTVVVTADPSHLTAPSAKTFTGELEITHGSNSFESTLIVPVSYTATASGSGGGNTVTATPTSVSFTQVQGGTAPSAKTVQLSASSATSFTAASTVSWVTVSPASGTTPQTLTLTANAGSMTPGTYTGTVNVTAGSTTTPISVTLTVTAPGSVTATPSSLTYSYTIGGSTPSSQTVQVSSTNATSFTAAGSASWITVSPTSGTTPQNVTVGINPSGLNAGTYNGSVNITAGSTTTTVPVTLTVTGSSSSPITPTPSSLSFTQVTGGSAPASQTVQLSSTTATPFTAAAGAGWLTVTPSSGTTPATLTVSANAAGFTAGTYQSSVLVTVGSTTTSIPVTLTVTGSTANPVTASPSSLQFAQTLGGSTPASQTIQLSSTTSTSFTAAPTQSWITVSPSSGTTPATLTVGVNATGLTAGTYQGAVTITAGASTSSIPVTFTVSSSSAGAISATPSSLTFTQAMNGASPGAQTVQLTSTPSTSFTAVSNQSWISVSPAFGTTPATLTVSANGVGLTTGSYQGSISVATDTSTTTIPVTLNVTSGTISAITATPPAIAFSQIAGQNSFSIQNIRLSSASPTTFTAASDQTWLTVSPSTGTTPATLTISANPGLTAGNYQGNITIAGGTTVVTVPVALTVSTASNSITASPNPVTFSQVSGGSAPGVQTLQLSSPSPTNFTAASTSTWLRVTPSSGTTPASLSLSVNPAGLTVGTYTDTITISGGAAPVTIPVTYTISNDAFTATPPSLMFTLAPGGNSPTPQTIQLGSSVPRNFTVVSSANWLTVTPSTGTTPATLTVGVNNGARLAVGPYQATITVNGAGTPLTIPVSLTVANATGAVFSPATVAFTSPSGSQTPLSQTVNVTSAASPFSFTATATAGNSGTWLAVTPTSGTTPAALNVTANPAGLSTGKYSGIVTITPSDTTIPVQTLPVTLTVGSSSTSSVFVRSILNAATWLPGSVAPGEIITITGTGLGPITGSVATVLASGAIDTTLAGTRVLFDGVPAPLLYVKADQINAIVPYNVFGRTTTNVVLEIAGVRSDPIGLRVDNTAPGVFTIDGSGTGQAAAVNQDGTINSPEFAAPRGSVVAIFGTGEGQTRPPGQDGRIVTTDLRTPISPVSVKIGGVPVTVRYFGSAPGQVSGLFQLNVFLPLDMPTGPQLPVEVTMGNSTPQFGLTIAVK